MYQESFKKQQQQLEIV
jgi:hypothetical protein